MKKVLLFLVTALSCILFAGCGDQVASVAGGGAKGSVLKDEGVAGKLLDELKERPELKGKELKIFQEVVISDIQGTGSGVQINLLKPGTTDQVDNYTYQMGKWNGPNPVQISGDGAMEDNLLPIDAIDFTKIASIYKIADQKAKEIEGGKVGEVLVYVMDYNDKAFRATIEINGAREKFAGTFDGKGNLISMNKK